MTDDDKKQLAKIVKAATEAVARCEEKHKAAEEAGEECDALAWVEIPAPLLKACLDQIAGDTEPKETIAAFRQSVKKVPTANLTCYAHQVLAVIKAAGLGGE